jgi:hypothetical protein
MRRDWFTLGLSFVTPRHRLRDFLSLKKTVATVCVFIHMKAKSEQESTDREIR